MVIDSDMNKTLLTASLILLTLSVVGCDGATKRLAKSHLENEPPVELVSGILDLRYTENPGVGFNLERVLPEKSRRPIVLGVRLLIMPLVVLLWLRNRERPWYEQAGYAVLLGGAIGNVGEMALFGHVVDFIYVTHWPVFNVADIALTTGVILLMLGQIMHRQPATQRA
jgi:signal peptidase II